MLANRQLRARSRSLVIRCDGSVRPLDHLHLCIEDLGEEVIAHNLGQDTEGSDGAVFRRADEVGVAGGEVDVVEDDHDRTAQLGRGRAEVLHHFDAVGDVEVAQSFVEKHIPRLLAQHHRNVRALALAAGQLVKEQSLERTRVEEVDVLGDDLLVVFGEAAPGGTGTARNRRPGEQ